MAQIIDFNKIKKQRDFEMSNLSKSFVPSHESVPLSEKWRIRAFRIGNPKVLIYNEVSDPSKNYAIGEIVGCWKWLSILDEGSKEIVLQAWEEGEIALLLPKEEP